MNASRQGGAGDNEKPIMEPLPFEASFDALAFIVKQIRAAASKPEVAELVPTLCFCFNSCSWDEVTGRILENIPYEHYLISWHHPEHVTDAVEVEIWGRNVFVPPETLIRLVGKQLVLITVDSGRRRKVWAERQLLMAVALAG